MPPSFTGTRIVLTPMPPTHLGAGAIDGLDDEVLVNTPRMPAAADIESILAAASGQGG